MIYMYFMNTIFQDLKTLYVYVFVYDVKYIFFNLSFNTFNAGYA